MRPLVALVLLAGLAGADATVNALRPVGFIVPAARAHDFYFVDPKAKDFWTPTQGEVDKLEAALSAYLQKAAPSHPGRRPVSARLGEYARHYVGVVVRGQRRIWLSAFIIADARAGDRSCTVAHVADPCMVRDGGDGYWRVLYDPATATLSAYEENGEG